MTFDVAVSGAAAEAVDRVLPQLISDMVASGITTQDDSLWGADAAAEAGGRLGWIEAVSVSAGLVPDIIALRDRLREDGVSRIVLAGMGGSSLAPELITRTAGVPLTVLDATDPGQVLSALEHQLETTALVVSSKSGSTIETDSQKRAFEHAFREAGIDPIERIVVVTDPGSPLDLSARADGYRVFNADPNVGGRYSALTAFGLVPSGLAGVDIQHLLDDADSVALRLALDHEDNPGLVLGAAIAGQRPQPSALGIVSDGTYLIGFGEWVEQLLAESTGKDGRGILPVVLELDAPELSARVDDLQVVRLVHDKRATESLIDGEIEISGTIGAQILVWEFATAVAGRLLGINPFDQPDVESAKLRARALLDERPEQSAPAFVDAGLAVRGTPSVVDGTDSAKAAVDRLLAAVGPDGYLAVQAYVDRDAMTELAELRSLLAARLGRPVTFGWGPRFLHSTGQFHKGGPATGAFLQITADAPRDLEIPGRPFTFGQLIQAQAAGDAGVLADHGRPVLTLTITDAATTGSIFNTVQ
ncbi:glucose-6-phosphate isomerase [Marisediminicola senii]|uniref:glucose-6-phosphate isomerase n=1 Tax=Marisediminicola senii TaxID=2711233 RepID=UPI0013EBE792|nr:glucose-6-phosphate isomerase [Marisediminicola senii]